jgi:hypothetical protein
MKQAEAQPHVLPPGTTQFQYMEIVYKARLNKMAKLLLSYYAFRYNFSERQACYATSRTIETQLCMSRGTYSTYKQYLLDLGWIKVQHRKGTSDFIVVRIGLDDPQVALLHPLPHQSDAAWSDLLKDQDA